MIHAQQLERYLGAEQIANIQAGMRGWYGPPIAVGRVPGAVLVRADGEFIGRFSPRRYASLIDREHDMIVKATRDFSRRGGPRHMGFSSQGDMIAEYTAGKGRQFMFNKAGTTGVVGGTNSLWGVGPQPAAGANAANAPAGESPTSATTGAFAYANPTGGDTLHYTTAAPFPSVGGGALLLYDRLFQVNKTMASTTAEAVTGVPTRYQNTSAGSADTAEGNFLFVEVGGTALAATAHNWTVCQYTNQAGTTAKTLPSLAGNASAIVRRLDHPLQSWFAPLASGDTGIKALTQMQCDASVATGVVNFVIGHVLAWMPAPVTNGLPFLIDAVNNAFGPARIFDNAALAFLEPNKPVTTAVTYNGMFFAVAG